MRISLVSEHASPVAVVGGVDAGGQNVYVAGLASALAAAGATVTVHTRRDDPTLPRYQPLGAGITVHHVDAGPAAPLAKDELLPYMGAFAADLARDWARRPPQAVHANFWMSGLASVTAARSHPVPVLLTYHASGVEKRRQQGSRDTSPSQRIAIERWLATAVDRVVATTEAERAVLCRQGVAPTQVRVIPCGVDGERFCVHGDRWPARTTRPRLVVVSRLVERKGIGNVITALAGLPDAELLVAGGPPQGLLQEDPEAVRLTELAARTGVGDRVELLGAVDRHRVPSLLRSADVVVCCPWYEPFGLVAVEAMACGRPVLATAVGGLAETVQHGVTGLLVPPRRPDAIAASLRRLLAEPATRAAMGAAGARRAQRYTWTAVAAELLAEIGRLRGAANEERAPAMPGKPAATAELAVSEDAR